MIVLSAGMKKSGSTWIFQLINELLMTIGHQDAYQTLRYLPRPAMLRRPYNLQLLLATIPHWTGRTYVLKSHIPPTPYIRQMVLSGAMKVIYSYRDPRDGALSMRDFGNRLRGEKRIIPPKASRIFTTEQAILGMKEQVNIWNAWNTFDSVLMIRYEDLLEDPIGKLRTIANYLDLQVPGEKLSMIINKYDKRNLSAAGEIDIKFNKGESERYLKEFTPEELKLSDEIFSPYLSQMGYPTYHAQ